MCDYSLESVASRPARVGDRLKTAGFKNTPSRGFADVNDPDVAVCLLPGTEVVFDHDAEYDSLRFFGPTPVGASAARFRRVNENLKTQHHDALEFANVRPVDRGLRRAVLRNTGIGYRHRQPLLAQHRHDGRVPPLVANADQGSLRALVLEAKTLVGADCWGIPGIGI